jgi:hypothetical protein
MYASKYSTYLAYPANTRASDVVEIDIDGLPPNIIFSISRNDNNSVYYERNDGSGARVRICDNHTARIGYRGYYARMTSDVGNLGSPLAPSYGSGLELQASIILEKTDVEEEEIKNYLSFYLLIYKIKYFITEQIKNYLSFYLLIYKIFDL